MGAMFYGLSISNIQRIVFQYVEKYHTHAIQVLWEEILSVNFSRPFTMKTVKCTYK